MGVWTLLILVVCPPAQTSLTPTLFQALCWVMETPVLGEAGSQCSQSDHLQRVRKHFTPFAGSLCSSLTPLRSSSHGPFPIQRAHLPSLTAWSREIKVWSACLHTLVSSRVTGTHLLQLLAWWGQGGSVREQSRPLRGSRAGGRVVPGSRTAGAGSPWLQEAAAGSPHR